MVGNILNKTDEEILRIEREKKLGRHDLPDPVYEFLNGQFPKKPKKSTDEKAPKAWRRKLERRLGLAKGELAQKTSILESNDRVLIHLESKLRLKPGQLLGEINHFKRKKGIPLNDPRKKYIMAQKRFAITQGGGRGQRVF